ncbi:MAG TPA: CIA30 family protein, partial [Dokdonella sp.]|uniref:CIA30 family protein n=1 Tax=Dokdonella sp. TaxID=2291710 RepID=UPI002D81110D
AGVDGLAHVFADEPVSNAFLRLAKEHGIFVIPTLSVVSHASVPGDATSLLEDPRISSHLSGGQRASLGAKFAALDKVSADSTLAIDNVRRLHATGIPILAGTDAGNPGTTHGASLHGELELLVQAGLSPEQALRAATSVPAEVFGMTDRGTIEIGKRADLVLVDGDPSQDIRASRAIETIWKNGFVVDTSATAQSEVVIESGTEATTISDFDGESIEANFGVGWQPSTDSLMGGSSTASLKRIADGANGSAGALEIRGRIEPGFAFPWAGAMFFPGSAPMRAVDISSRREIVFQARGDGREYSVLLLSGEDQQGMPAMQGFVAGPEWKEIRVPLADFAGANPGMLRGIGFSAGLPVGDYRFEVDQVELR